MINDIKRTEEYRKPDFEDFLEDRFPNLINDYFSCNIMKGWERIVLEIFLEVEKNKWDIKFDQIKEKFGDIRVYFSNNIEDKEENEIARNWIYQKCIECNKTCEACGKRQEKIEIRTRQNPESMTRSGYWLKGFCDDCHRKRDLGENI